MCGGSYPHQGQCPAQGKQYANCSTLNHFAKVCRSASFQKSNQPKTVQTAQIHTSDEGDGDMDDDGLEGTIHVIHAMEPGGGPRRLIPKCNILVGGKPVVALIDTGASINLMALQVMKTLLLKPTLRSITTKVFAFGSSIPLPLAGVFNADFMHEAQTVNTNIYFTKAWSGMLLSCRTAEHLGLVSFAFSVHQDSIEGLIAEYSELFNGICHERHLTPTIDGIVAKVSG
ncbi:hypothetical protein NDU88_001032 [Pleurodeles waltl]|uniref:Uncharacterized protein n=1 Tax=Pleurodeles waltl TaxID=8319 RepID=A0AAV7SYF6_PLEWA|nr:hypothetical protein NDU88_001032 [Pleurodeles waltl]